MSDKKLEQQLNEEIQRWNFNDLVAAGKPDHPAFAGLPGFSVELMQLELRVHALIETIIKLDIISKEVLDRAYQEELLDRLTRARESIEQKQPPKPSIITANKQLFGPNGEPLH